MEFHEIMTLTTSTYNVTSNQRFLPTDYKNSHLSSLYMIFCKQPFPKNKFFTWILLQAEETAF